VNTYGITPFDGNNYDAWKFRLTSILKAEAVGVALERDGFKPGQKDFETKNAKCMSLIVRFLGDSHLGYAQNAEYAYEIIEKLDEVYQVKGTASRVYLKKSWQALKLKNGSDLEEHFRRFDDLTVKLRAAGCTLNDSDVTEQLLMSLSEEYNVTVEVLESMEKPSMEVVRAKLRNRYVKLTKGKESKSEHADVSSDVAMFGSNKEISHKKAKCYNCGRSGHIKRNCWSLKKKESSEENTETRSRGNQQEDVKRCFNCMGRGHIAKYCRKPKSTANVADHKQRSSSKENAKLSTSSNKDPEDFFSFMAGNELMRGEKKNKEDVISFFLDSGASSHYICDASYFSESIELKEPIEVGVYVKGVSAKATKIGRIYCKINDRKIILKNVLYSCDFPANLLSVKRLALNGVSASFDVDMTVKLMCKNVVVAEGIAEGPNLYRIDFCLDRKNCAYMISDNRSTASEVNLQLWHKRLGHPNYQMIEKMERAGLIDFDRVKEEEIRCVSCVEGKMCKLPHFSQESKAAKVLEVVHSDIVGPIRTTSHTGKRFILSFLDEFTAFSTVYVLESKTQVLEKFKEYVARTKNLFNCNIKEFRCDNGTEFTNREFREYCKSLGIRMGFSPPYCPQCNGRIERFNRTLIEKTRTLIKDSGLEKKFWDEAILCAAFLYNRTMNSKGQVPAVSWYNKNVDYSRLRVFGCNAFFLVPKAKGLEKFEGKTYKLTFVGYNPEGYRLLDQKSGKIIISRDVKFDESSIKSSNVNDMNDLNEDEFNEKVCQCDKVNENEEIELDFMAYTDVAYFLNEQQLTYNDVKSDSNWINWKTAIDAELNAINENGVWTLVDKPEDVKAINTKWVFKIKSSGLFKARLVVRGFESDQEFSFRDIFSPVAKLSTVRLALSIALNLDFVVQQIDVQNAFLHSTLDESVYVNIPEGYEIDSKKFMNPVLKLKKALYGLKQSPKCWNSTLDDFLVSLNFNRCTFDQCLYFREVNGNLVFCVVYVDDMLICGKNVKVVEDLIKVICGRFKCKVMKKVRSFLGLEIDYRPENGVCKINQRTLIERLKKTFNVTENSGAATPVEEKLYFNVDKIKNEFKNSENLVTKYKRLLGSLMYVMLGSRPDLCYSISTFSQFQNFPSQSLYNYLLRVLRYLVSTKDLSLNYVVNERKIVTYVDADWANCPNTRRSVSGFGIFVCGNIVDWKSKKQSIVTTSSTDSEIVALTDSAYASIALRNILVELNIDVERRIYFMEDNQNCVRFCEGSSKKSKHVEVRYYFVRDLVRAGDVEVKTVRSSDQLADTFTKGLGKFKFEMFRNRIGLRV
jgi:hypothetical protein